MKTVKRGGGTDTDGKGKKGKESEKLAKKGGGAGGDEEGRKCVLEGMCRDNIFQVRNRAHLIVCVLCVLCCALLRSVKWGIRIVYGEDPTVCNVQRLFFRV